MSRLDEFIQYLEAQVANHSIYIWGGQGQTYPTLTEAWIKKKESGSNLTKALKTFRAAVAAGFEKLCCAYDCSGLGMYWLYNLKKIYKSDKNANGMKGECTLIDKKHLKRGDWVFRTYKSGTQKGRAYHIGYVVDDALNVIEARGRAYGVVKRSLDASGTGYWNTFGRPKCFVEDIDTTEELLEHASFNRNLKKGMKGDDVAELQRLLNKAGDDLAVDGDFGSKTYEAVRVFQSRAGLAVDGIAGAKTIAALMADKIPEQWGIIRLVKRGSQGNDVKHVQNALIVAGYSVGKTGADGDFGKNTEAAVIRFQKEKGLEADGIVGKNTVEALGGKWKE